MKALIDCGATGEFIDHEFVRVHELRTYQLPRPIRLYNADGSPNEIRKITEAIDLIVQYKGHKSRSKFYVSSVGRKAIVLDTPGSWSTTLTSTGTQAKSN